MTKMGSWSVLTKWEQLLRRCCFFFAIAMLIFTTGCATMDGLFKKTETDGPSKEQIAEQELELRQEQALEQERVLKQEQAARQEQAEQVTKLQSREIELEREVRTLNAKLKADRVTRESLIMRLAIAQAAREDAIREVVRIRARIQGMASQAEASAMFAEARVILDRMEEEAFNEQALEDLGLARSYMARGKGALDTGNPGGAAYLFDLIPGLYEGIKKSDPRMLKVNVSVAALRKSPVSSSPKIGSIYWGESVIGLEKSKEWVKVRTSPGQTGWLMRSQVQ